MHRTQPDCLDDYRRAIHVAGTPLQATGGSIAASAYSAQLAILRTVISGPWSCVARFAIRIRAIGGLWGHRCGGARAVFAAVAATQDRRRDGIDFQYLGVSRSAECFVPGQSRRALGGTIGRYIFSSHSCGAAAADSRGIRGGGRGVYPIGRTRLAPRVQASGLPP